MNWIKGAFVTGVELHRWEYLTAVFVVGFGVGFIAGFLDSIMGTTLVPIAILVSIYTTAMSTFNRCRTIGVHGGWAFLALVPFVSLILTVVLFIKDAKKETT